MNIKLVKVFMTNFFQWPHEAQGYTFWFSQKFYEASNTKLYLLPALQKATPISTHA